MCNSYNRSFFFISFSFTYLPFTSVVIVYTSSCFTRLYFFCDRYCCILSTFAYIITCMRDVIRHTSERCYQYNTTHLTIHTLFFFLSFCRSYCLCLSHIHIFISSNCCLILFFSSCTQKYNIH